jgi:hypothetical protein
MPRLLSRLARRQTDALSTIVRAEKQAFTTWCWLQPDAQEYS